MLLTLTRFKWTAQSVLGQLTINHDPLFYSSIYDKPMPIYTLEDTDRDLHDYMTVKEIKSVKVAGKTAIPYCGKKKVVFDFSQRFQKIMPHILDVKGFEGIRIHNGSFIGDTDGCILVGHYWHKLMPENNYMVSKSRDCFKELSDYLFKVSQTEEIFLEIIK